jgi:hypothetical protein
MKDKYETLKLARFQLHYARRDVPEENAFRSYFPFSFS